MKIALVGCGGFLGTATAEHLLAHGHRLSLLDKAHRLERLAAMAGEIERFTTSDFCSADLRAGFKGCDAIIHLAYTSMPSFSSDRIIEDIETNVLSSVRVFEAAVAEGVEKVIFISSGGAVYGAPASLPVTEDHPPDPISPYGVSKLTVEKYLAYFARQHEFAGISLRVGNPYGPYQLGQKLPVGLIARCVQTTVKGETLEIWGDGSVIRDYLYISDLVEAFRKALDTPNLPTGAYNIGSGVGHSVNDIVAAVEAVSGKPLQVEYKLGRNFDVPEIVLDPSRFKQLTDWSKPLPLEAGIESLMATFR